MKPPSTPNTEYDEEKRDRHYLPERKVRTRRQKLSVDEDIDDDGVSR